MDGSGVRRPENQPNETGGWARSLEHVHPRNGPKLRSLPPSGRCVRTAANTMSARLSKTLSWLERGIIKGQDPGQNDGHWRVDRQDRCVLST